MSLKDREALGFEVFSLRAQNIQGAKRLPWCLDGKASACNAGNWSSIPGSGRSPGEGNGNPLLLPGKSHGQRSLVD